MFPDITMMSTLSPADPSYSTSAYAYNNGQDASHDEFSGTGSGNALSKDEKIGLGVGFAIGIPILLVTTITCLQYRKRLVQKLN